MGLTKLYDTTARKKTEKKGRGYGYSAEENTDESVTKLPASFTSAGGFPAPTDEIRIRPIGKWDGKTEVTRINLFIRHVDSRSSEGLRTVPLRSPPSQPL